MVGWLFALLFLDPSFGSGSVAPRGALVGARSAVVVALPGESTPRSLGAVVTPLYQRLRLVVGRPEFCDKVT